MSDMTPNASTTATTADPAIAAAAAIMDAAAKMPEGSEMEAPDPDDAVHAAAEEAIASVSAESGIEPKAVADPAKAAPDPAKEARLAVVMRARKHADAVRQQANAEAEAKLRAAEAKIREADELREMFRHKPIEALRKAGIDPKDFFAKTLEDGEALTPEAEYKRELTELRQQLESLRHEKEAEREAQRKAKEEAALQDTHSRFLKFTLEEQADNYPHIDALFGTKKTALANKALEISTEYANKTGQWPTFKEIADFLEEVCKAEYDTMEARRKQRLSVKASPPAEGSSSRTISGSDAAVRATTPKTLRDMSTEERNKLAEAAAAKAMGR